MNQDRVVSAVEDDLKGFLDAFGGDLDVRVLVGGKNDLKVLDAVFLHEFDIFVGIIRADKSTASVSL